jgi:BirA family biotin operon repressor/biotin-[acetyl-CoA-carboxylase] ligase
MDNQNRLLPRLIRDRLVTTRLGRRIYYLPETDSTNRVAAELAAHGEPEGTVVITDYQRRGRGRLDRTWASPPFKSLLFSILLRPGDEVMNVQTLTLVFSLAVSQTLSAALGKYIQVKWPNDVLCDGRKLCGILAESTVRSGRTDCLIVGIGLNVNTREEQFEPAIRETAASCRTLTGRSWDRLDLLAQLLEALEDGYTGFQTDGFNSFRQAYRERLAILQKPVSFELKGQVTTGLVEDINPDGSLAVILPSGERWDLFGEEITLL